MTKLSHLPQRPLSPTVPPTFFLKNKFARGCPDEVEVRISGCDDSTSYFFLCLSFERPAYGYTDPGSAILIFQSLSAVVTGSLFLLPANG